MVRLPTMLLPLIDSYVVAYDDLVKEVMIPTAPTERKKKDRLLLPEIVSSISSLVWHMTELERQDSMYDRTNVTDDDNATHSFVVVKKNA